MYNQSVYLVAGCIDKISRFMQTIRFASLWRNAKAGRRLDVGQQTRFETTDVFVRISLGFFFKDAPFQCVVGCSNDDESTRLLSLDESLYSGYQGAFPRSVARDHAGEGKWHDPTQGERNDAGSSLVPLSSSYSEFRVPRVVTAGRQAVQRRDQK